MLGCKQIGKKAKGIVARDKKVISPSLTREYPLVIDKAEDVWIWDVDGNKYLDFSSLIAVMNIGHSNPYVIKAIQKQLKKATHAAFSDFYAELPVTFAEQIVSVLPRGFDRVFFSNSGTEAVEAALKLSRWNKRKPYFVSFINSFHGRTMGSLSLTYSKPVHREGFGPFLSVRHVPYAYPYRMGSECTTMCLNELEKALYKGDVSAVFMEPIQGEGGYIVPPKEFVKGIRKLCDEYDVLMVDDEIQAGCFRTGKFLAIEHFNVKPDIICLGKAIGGGLPIGVTVASKKLMRWPHGAHANTFGGNLLSCAAGMETLKQLKRVGKSVVKKGRYIMRRLDEMKDRYGIIGDVRGKGLMIGVELVKDKRTKKPAIEEREQILWRSFFKGLILLPAGRSTIRIIPPLTITIEHIDRGMDIIEDAVKSVSR